MSKFGIKDIQEIPFENCSLVCTLGVSKGNALMSIRRFEPPFPEIQLSWDTMARKASPDKIIAKELSKRLLETESGGKGVHHSWEYKSAPLEGSFTSSILISQDSRFYIKSIIDRRAAILLQRKRGVVRLFADERYLLSTCVLELTKQDHELGKRILAEWINRWATVKWETD